MSDARVREAVDDGRSSAGLPDLSPLDDASTPFFTIGQVASLLGIGQAALRRLESEEFVAPGRPEGGHRCYSRRDVERLREVVGLISEGLTPAGVRKVLALSRRIRELEDQVAALRADAQPQ